ncbi:hypothetical protein QR685DRAFT_130688 [Neurospora intermedia]|uniref:Secreted protein n=1 Tax=Neurospora intermedia TaxID=5142 RepID=A0ABR3CYG2_NEUIN
MMRSSVRFWLWAIRLSFSLSGHFCSSWRSYYSSSSFLFLFDFPVFGQVSLVMVLSLSLGFIFPRVCMYRYIMECNSQTVFKSPFILCIFLTIVEQVKIP